MIFDYKNENAKSITIMKVTRHFYEVFKINKNPFLHFAPGSTPGEMLKGGIEKVQNNAKKPQIIVRDSSI
jgi:hypothetical protein